MCKDIIYLAVLVSIILRICHGTYFYRPKYQLMFEHRQYMRYPRPVFNPVIKESIVHRFPHGIEMDPNKLPHVHVTLEDEIYAHVHRYDGKPHIHRDPVPLIVFGNEHRSVFNNHRGYNREIIPPQLSNRRLLRQNVNLDPGIIPRNQDEVPRARQSDVFTSNSGLQDTEPNIPKNIEEKILFSDEKINDRLDPDYVLINSPAMGHEDSQKGKAIPGIDNNNIADPGSFPDFWNGNRDNPIFSPTSPFPGVSGNSVVVDSFIPELMDPSAIYIDGIPKISNKEKEPVSVRPLEPLATETDNNDTLPESAVDLPNPLDVGKEINIFINDSNINETMITTTANSINEDNTTPKDNILAREMIVPSPEVKRVTKTPVIIPDPLSNKSLAYPKLLPNPLSPIIIESKLTLPFPLTRQGFPALEQELPRPAVHDTDTNQLLLPLPLSESIVPEVSRSPIDVPREPVGVFLPNPLNALTASEESTMFTLPVPKTKHQSVLIPGPLTSSQEEASVIIPAPPKYNSEGLIPIIPTPPKHNSAGSIPIIPAPPKHNSDGQIPSPISPIDNPKGITLPDPKKKVKLNHEELPDPLILNKTSPHLPEPLVPDLEYPTVYNHSSIWFIQQGSVFIPNSLTKKQDQTIIPEPELPQTSRVVIPNPVTMPVGTMPDENNNLPYPVTMDMNSRHIIQVSMTSGPNSVGSIVPYPITQNNDIGMSLPEPVKRGKTSEIGIHIPSPTYVSHGSESHDLPQAITPDSEILKIQNPITKTDDGSGIIYIPKPSISDAYVIDLPKPLIDNNKEETVSSTRKSFVAIPDPLVQETGMEPEKDGLIPDPTTETGKVSIPVLVTQRNVNNKRLPKPLNENNSVGNIPIPSVIRKKKAPIIVQIPGPITKSEKSYEKFVPTPVVENHRPRDKNEDLQPNSNIFIPIPADVFHFGQPGQGKGDYAGAASLIPIPKTPTRQTNMTDGNGGEIEIVMPIPITATQNDTEEGFQSVHYVITRQKVIIEQNLYREVPGVSLPVVEIPNPITSKNQNSLNENSEFPTLHEVSIPTVIKQDQNSRGKGTVVVPLPKVPIQNKERKIYENIKPLTVITDVLKGEKDTNNETLVDVNIPTPLTGFVDKRTRKGENPDSLADVEIPTPLSAVDFTNQEATSTQQPVMEDDISVNVTSPDIISTGYINDTVSNPDSEIISASRKRDSVTKSTQVPNNSADTTKPQATPGYNSRESSTVKNDMDTKMPSCGEVGCPFGFVCVSNTSFPCHNGQYNDMCQCEPGCIVKNKFIPGGKSIIIDDCGSRCICHRDTGKVQCSYRSCDKNIKNISTIPKREFVEKERTKQKHEGISDGGLIYVPIPTSKTDEVARSLKDASSDWSSTSGISMGGVIYIPNPTRQRRKQTSGITKGGIIYVPLKPKSTKEVSYALDKAATKWSHSKGISRGGVIRIPITSPTQDGTAKALKNITSSGWDQITGISKGGVIYVPLPTTFSRNATIVLEDMTKKWSKSTGISRGGIIYVPVPTSDISDTPRDRPTTNSRLDKAGLIYVPLLTTNTNVPSAIEDATSNISRISGISMGGIIYIPLNGRRNVKNVQKTRGITRGGFINVPIPRRRKK